MNVRGLFSNKSVGVACRHEIKRRIEKNRRFNIDDIHCQWHLHAPPAVLHVAVHVKTYSFPGKSLMQSIKPRLYKADNDQAAVVMARLDEASQTLLQSLSNSALATKRRLSQQDPQSARQSSEKRHYLSTRLGEDVCDVDRLVTILAHAMCKHLKQQ
ncbi:hypothetical protein BASA50_001824 [Batrachochytrium salamandrivorans]|uniref:Uncharacterized protein n=1 Tax=Batrachochytrium salamandrivorans TaxID=1357716 RepID=A0ABQ8FR73_9FUNG|nr:hypothetical protein BASA50_001824 [Batrachochytrium salamandrivorans]KAH9252763.1 hypothetical protein BASA81_009273 [Batrachochytrium salamandrivorans]